MILHITHYSHFCKNSIPHKKINEQCNEWASLNCTKVFWFLTWTCLSFFPAFLSAPDISNGPINNCLYRAVGVLPFCWRSMQSENEFPFLLPPSLSHSLLSLFLFFFQKHFCFPLLLCLCLQCPAEHAEMMSVLSDCSFFQCQCFQDYHCFIASFFRNKTQDDGPYIAFLITVLIRIEYSLP